MLNSIAFENGSPITVFVHVVILSYLCFYNFYRNEFCNRFNYIYFYILFLFVLVLLSSSQYFASFRLLIKYTEQLLCLPIAFGLFNGKANVEKMWFTLKTMLVLFIINYFVANYFHLGGAVYVEVGGGDIGNVSAIDDFHYINAVFICVMPVFMWNEYRFGFLWKIAVIFAFVLVVTSIKRTSIACMILPLIVGCFYKLYFRIKYRTFENHIVTPRKVLGYAVSLFFIFFLAISFRQIVELRVAKRFERFDSGISKEGRTMELKCIYDDIVENGDLPTFLFGKETFNTVGTYANGKFGKRMIHENYGIILNGTGVVGLFFYIFINMYIILLFVSFSRSVDLSSNIMARRFYVTFVSLWVIFIVSSFSGNIWCTMYPSMHYTFSGLILRYFYEYGKTYS